MSIALSGGSFGEEPAAVSPRSWTAWAWSCFRRRRRVRQVQALGDELRRVPAR